MKSGSDWNDISQEDESNPAVPHPLILAISDTGVQHFGCWALANVGWGQADVQKFTKEEGALEAIQARIRVYLGSSTLASGIWQSVVVIGQSCFRASDGCSAVIP